MYVDTSTHTKHGYIYEKNNESINHKIKQKVNFTGKKGKGWRDRNRS